MSVGFAATQMNRVFQDRIRGKMKLAAVIDEKSFETAHACQMKDGTHFYGNDNRCVFCTFHRDPR